MSYYDAIMNEVPYEEMDHGIRLPKLDELVINRLEAGGAVLANVDDSAMGRVIKRQIQRQLEGKGTGQMRLSQAGGCIRKLAYIKHHFKPTGHTPDVSSLVTFALGDATEQLMTMVLKDAFERLPWTTSLDSESKPVELFQIKHIMEQQRTVSLQVELGDDRCMWVDGHPDGEIVVPAFQGVGSMPQPVEATLECKSMSDYAFKLFRQNGGLTDDDPYLDQVTAYMAATGTKWAYVLAFGKNVTTKDWQPIDAGSVETWKPSAGNWKQAPNIVGSWVRFDPERAERIKHKFRQVEMSTDPEQFERPYSPTKKGRLKFPCDWCMAWRHCWPDAHEEPVDTGWFQKFKKIHLLT